MLCCLLGKCLCKPDTAAEDNGKQRILACSKHAHTVGEVTSQGAKPGLVKLRQGFSEKANTAEEPKQQLLV